MGPIHPVWGHVLVSFLFLFDPFGTAAAEIKTNIAHKTFSTDGDMPKKDREITGST